MKEQIRQKEDRDIYYYLYVKCGEIGGWGDMIKVYFVSESNANEAMVRLMQKAGIAWEEE